MILNRFRYQLKDRKRRPEGGGEWEPQISFEIFDHCPNINPQKAYTIDLMTTTLEKGGCSLRIQWVTTKQTEHRSEPKRANSQKKTALPLQISDTSGIMSDTSGIFGHVRYFQQQADQGRKIQNPVKRCPKNMKFLTIALRHQGKVSTKFQLKTPKLEISDTS